MCGGRQLLRRVTGIEILIPAFGVKQPPKVHSGRAPVIATLVGAFALVLPIQSLATSPQPSWPDTKAKTQFIYFFVTVPPGDVGTYASVNWFGLVAICRYYR